MIPRLFIAISLFAAPSAGAVPCGGEFVDGSVEVRQAVALYDEGWGGSDPALLEAMERLEGLLASPERSALVRAYFGSSCVARARMVPDRQKRTWLRRGAAELDKAVKAAPEDLQVRLLRAVTFAVLPRIAGRIDTARNDFDWLIERVEEEPGLTSACRRAILYHAGAFAMRNRDSRALDLLERAAEIESEGTIDRERVVKMLQLARDAL